MDDDAGVVFSSATFFAASAMAAFFCFLRRQRRKKASAATINTSGITVPIAALAPIDRPPLPLFLFDAPGTPVLDAKPPDPVALADPISLA
jgi:hypothetical protein